MIDVNLYATIGAKLCREDPENPPIQFTMHLFNQRLAVAELVARSHTNFAQILQMMKESNDDLINQRDYAPKIIAEFDAMFELFQNNQSIANDIYFAILFAAQGTFLERANEDKGASTGLMTIVDNMSIEPEGFASIALLSIALWFSNFKDYQNLVYQKINELKREGWYSEDKNSQSGGNTGIPDEIQNKINFMESFAQEALRDKESVKNDTERMKKFLSIYMETAKSSTPPTNIRLAFLQSILGTPEFAHREANFVSADYFNREFDMAVNDDNVNGKGLAASFANSCLYGKALMECVGDTETNLDDANWTFIAKHVDVVAKKLGWDGRYEDEPQISLEKRNSELFKNLHNCGHMLPNTGTREDNAVVLGVIMASLIEKYLNKNPNVLGKNGLLAVSGILNTDYKIKNQPHISEFNEDLIKAANATMPGLVALREKNPNDVEMLMISAFILSLTTGFRPDALVYFTMGEILTLEKKGTPVNEISMNFGILGYLVEFEKWHDITFGGALPIGHSNSWDSSSQQSRSQSQSSYQSQSTRPTQKSGGCYIATSVYGSYDCPEVWVLRRFRDKILSTSIFGRAFISLYYKLSPAVVKYLGRTEWFSRFWKTKLDKAVTLLRKNGLSDQKYDD